MLKNFLLTGVILLMIFGFTACQKNQEDKIREDYLTFMHAQGEIEMDIDDVKILQRYSSYNGAVVIRMERPAFEVITTVKAGGIDFIFDNTNTALIWKNGRFFELLEAYENGTLTKDNLTDLVKKVNKHQYNSITLKCLS